MLQLCPESEMPVKGVARHLFCQPAVRHFPARSIHSSIVVFGPHRRRRLVCATRSLFHTAPSVHPTSTFGRPAIGSCVHPVHLFDHAFCLSAAHLLLSRESHHLLSCLATFVKPNSKLRKLLGSFTLISVLHLLGQKKFYVIEGQ